jgi:NTP pyrophosphatase (non-canonical NTP hydrolase)
MNHCNDTWKDEMLNALEKSSTISHMMLVPGNEEQPSIKYVGPDLHFHFDDRLQQLMNSHKAWEESSFKNATVLGKLHHLQEEVKEVIAAVELDAFPDATKEEFADCFLLLIGSARQFGLNASDLLHEAEKKLAIVKQRKYGKPDANGVRHHIKETKSTTTKNKK